MKLKVATDDKKSPIYINNVLCRESDAKPVVTIVDKLSTFIQYLIEY